MPGVQRPFRLMHLESFSNLRLNLQYIELWGSPSSGIDMPHYPTAPPFSTAVRPNLSDVSAYGTT
jgi:hypothetical protein